MPVFKAQVTIGLRCFEHSPDGHPKSPVGCGWAQCILHNVFDTTKVRWFIHSFSTSTLPKKSWLESSKAF